MNKTQQKSYSYFYGVYCTADLISSFIRRSWISDDNLTVSKIMKEFGDDESCDVVWELAVKTYDRFREHDKKHWEDMSEYDAILKFIQDRVLRIGEVEEKYDESEEE